MNAPRSVFVKEVMLKEHCPRTMYFSNNVFYNTSDSIIYNVYDDIKGIRFGNNKVSNNINQSCPMDL